VAYNFLAGEQEQLHLLLPPSLTEWLPEDHLAFFVQDAVGEIDLSAFYAGYRADGWGGAAHDPQMMVALLLYSYCVGVRSSCQIERACQVDVAFGVLAANQIPDHTTIARFRQRHEQTFQDAVQCVVAVVRAGRDGHGGAGRAGRDEDRRVGVDGRHRGKDVIEAEVEKMFAEAAALDEVEDAEDGSGSGPQPPAELRGRADRRRRFAAAKKLLEAEAAAERAAHEARLAARAATEAARGTKLGGRKPKPASEKSRHKTPRANTTDPESPMMATKQGVRAVRPTRRR
jgi:transposase